MERRLAVLALSAEPRMRLIMELTLWARHRRPWVAWSVAG